MSTANRTRAKRALGVAALWLALAAAVFLYTDPNEYAWHYDAGGMWQILESEADAAARQAERDALMERERAEAAERRAANRWGKDNGDIYNGEPRMLPAQDENLPGLNLMEGTYDLLVRYTAETPVRLRVVAPGRQPFVRDGEYTLEPAQDGALETSFRLVGTSFGVMLAGDLPEGARIEQVSVRRHGTGVFSRDLAVYTLFAGGVLTFLYALSWDERRRLARRDAMVLVCAAAFASVPSLWYGMLDGHDLFFHLNRIEGIAAGLRAGEFPVRIHSTTILGYGYAAPEFYPELFLYFPALLRVLGASLTTCVSVFQMAVNLAAAGTAYACARRLFGSRRIALGAGVLYALSVDRVVNLYIRGSLGESVAMVFFPVVIMALVDVLIGDERRWPLLALGAVGIFMSHLLSTLFTAAFCALAALLCARRLLREPRRILAIVKAAALTTVCSLWFFVPFLCYSAEDINTNLAAESYRNVMSLGSLLISFAGNVSGVSEADEDFAYHVGVIPGAALLCGCALLLVRLYARGGALRARASLKDDGGRGKLARALLSLGALALLCTTSLFPWEFLCHTRPPISTIAAQAQFPWRLVAIATPLLTMAAAYGYLQSERTAHAGMALLCALSVVFCGYTLTAYFQGNSFYEASFCCDTRIGQYEYIYVGTEKGALEAGRFDTSDGPAQVIEFERNGTALYARLSTPETRGYFDAPLLYYPGYHASVNGVETSVERVTNNVMRVYNNSGQSEVELRVWYEEPALWRGAEIASAAGMLLLAALLLMRRRRTAGA